MGSMEDDPLDRLLGELLDAHDRSLPALDQPSTTVKGHRRWRRRRPIVVLAAVLVFSGSAAAAVVIETQKSAPLAGALPELLGSRYALQVEPDLRTGHAGWCIKLHTALAHGAALPNPETCVPAGRSPVVTSGGIARVSATTGATRGLLLYAVVTGRVAALKAPNGARILPISSPGLPDGWRAAITIETRPRFSRRGATTLTPLNATGARIRLSPTRPTVFPAVEVNPRARHRGCRITAARPAHIRLLKAYGLREPLPQFVPTANGFLSCYSITFDFRRRTSTATVLVNAQHPGASPAALPGFIELRFHRSVWTRPAVGAGKPYPGPTGRLFAERFNGGWLVVRTVAPMNAVVGLLHDLVPHV